MCANEIVVNCCCLFYKFGSGGSNYLEKHFSFLQLHRQSFMQKLKELIYYPFFRSSKVNRQPVLKSLKH